VLNGILEEEVALKMWFGEVEGEVEG